MDRGVWWAAVHSVTHSRTQLKRLSSSSSSSSSRCSNGGVYYLEHWFWSLGERWLEVEHYQHAGPKVMGIAEFTQEDKIK